MLSTDALNVQIFDYFKISTYLIHFTNRSSKAFVEKSIIHVDIDYRESWTDITR